MSGVDILLHPPKRPARPLNLDAYQHHSTKAEASTRLYIQTSVSYAWVLFLVKSTLDLEKAEMWSETVFARPRKYFLAFRSDYRR